MLLESALDGNPASWYDGVVAVIGFESGKAKTVTLYSLDVGDTNDLARRGIPRLATIVIEGSVGVIRIPSASAALGRG